ncbi:MAG TPA: type II secretion system F family protein [archaeon]|nr:type II secretion system F family protein [archaeon]
MKLKLNAKARTGNNFELNLSPEKKIVVISVIITSITIGAGYFTGNAGVIGNGIILGIFLIAVPLILFRYEKFRTIKEIEEKFPLFLRDVVEAIHSGMPFHQAIAANSKIDYGRLSKEVRKMANQISWGMPVNKVLDQFTERVKSSKRLFSSLKTVRESYLTGGDVVSTLDSVAENLTQLDEAEKEKHSLLNQYVILMYAVAFIFVGILASINKLLIPVFQVAQTPGAAEVLGLSNPCLNPIGIEGTICDLYSIPAKYVFLIDPTTIGAYYTSLFFFMSVIVSLSAGLVAGQISENSITAGLKHSAIMTSGVIGTMLILKFVNLLGV